MTVRADRPPWENLAGTFGLVAAAEADMAPMVRHRADQGAAALRDRFDAYGITLADEWSIYTVLVTLKLVGGQLRHGVRAGVPLVDLLGVVDGDLAILSSCAPVAARP